MSKPRPTAAILSGAVLLLLGCGAPGLPPAGPQPGEVNVGYGTEEEGKTTGAVTSVSGKELAETQSANIEELLRGKVPGLEILPQPGGGYRFRIRGVGSPSDDITGGSQPLFVVDGTPTDAEDIETALSGLTREDIRQVDVLKDIASTSIYGQRGNGGVIIINTRR